MSDGIGSQVRAIQNGQYNVQKPTPLIDNAFEDKLADIRARTFADRASADRTADDWTDGTARQQQDKKDAVQAMLDRNNATVAEQLLLGNTVDDQGTGGPYPSPALSRLKDAWHGVQRVEQRKVYDPISVRPFLVDKVIPGIIGAYKAAIGWGLNNSKNAAQWAVENGVPVVIDGIKSYNAQQQQKSTAQQQTPTTQQQTPTTQQQQQTPKAKPTQVDAAFEPWFKELMRLDALGDDAATDAYADAKLDALYKTDRDMYNLYDKEIRKRLNIQ